MKIKYDKTADAKYIRLRDESISSTKPEKDWLLFDYSSNGEVVGIEILDASKNPVNLHIIDGKFSSYHCPDENKIPGAFNKDVELNRESIDLSVKSIVMA